MTEDRPPIDRSGGTGLPPVQRLDRAIDRAIREMTDHEPPAGLRARVLARLEQPAPGSAWWSPVRAAWAGAAVVVVVATFLAWVSRPAPVAGPGTVVAEARPPAQVPDSPAAGVPPETQTGRSGADVTAGEPPAAGPSERVVVAAVAEPKAYVFRSPRVVARLEPPDSISIDPMPAEPAGLERITVEPLTLERIAVEPLGDSR